MVTACQCFLFGNESKTVSARMAIELVYGVPYDMCSYRPACPAVDAALALLPM